MIRFVRLALCLITLAVAPAAFAQTPAKLRFTLDWVIQGQHAPFLLAKAKGYFDQEGVDVTIDVGNGSAGAVQRLASGAYDMGFADLSTLIEFLGNNPNLPRPQAVYMVHERNPNALFAMKKSGIAKPADLKGKKAGPRRSWPDRRC